MILNSYGPSRSPYITDTVTDIQVKVEFSKQTYRIIFSYNIIFAFQTNENVVEKCNGHFIYKGYFDEKSTNLFKQKLHETTWDNIKNIKKPNEAYRKFVEILSSIYESFFSNKDYLKSKN